MGRAVIENEMDDLQARTQGALKQLQQEGFEVGECFAAAGLGEGHPRRDHQRTEQLHGTHPLIPVGDMDGPSQEPRPGSH